MSNTHSIPSAASFDANPRCILPDAIIDPISDELQAIEKLAERAAMPRATFMRTTPHTGPTRLAGLLNRDYSHRGRPGESHGYVPGTVQPAQRNHPGTDSPRPIV